jgi:hypothetical protein
MNRRHFPWSRIARIARIQGGRRFGADVDTERSVSTGYRGLTGGPDVN